MKVSAELFKHKLISAALPNHCRGPLAHNHGNGYHFAADDIGDPDTRHLWQISLQSLRYHITRLAVGLYPIVQSAGNTYVENFLAFAALRPAFKRRYAASSYNNSPPVLIALMRLRIPISNAASSIPITSIRQVPQLTINAFLCGELRNWSQTMTPSQTLEPLIFP
jgi:hypothetical protein